MTDRRSVGDQRLKLPGWLQTAREGTRNGIIEGTAFLLFVTAVGLVSRWLGPFDDGIPFAALLIGIGLGAGITVLLGYRWIRHRQTTSDAALDDADRLLKLDETLFRHLLVLTETDDVEQAIKGVIREVLQNIVAFFGDDVVRGIVLRPSDDALCAWVGYQMPPESMERLRFPYDTPVGTQKGVALRAYETNTIRYVVMKKNRKDGRWVANSKDYVVHDSQRHRPPYAVFVAIPLALDAKVLGVLCLDSSSVSSFEKSRDDQRLRSIALRVSAPLAVFDSLATHE